MCQRGFTTIELMVYLAAIAMLGVATVAVNTEMRRGKLEASIKNAKVIANYADVYRSRIASESVGGSGEIVRSYQTLAAGTPVSTLNTAMGTSLPTKSFFQTNYTVEAPTNRSARVSFSVPYVTTPSHVQAIVSGSTTTITVTAGAILPSPGAKRARFMKEVFYLENSP